MMAAAPPTTMTAAAAATTAPSPAGARLALEDVKDDWQLLQGGQDEDPDRAPLNDPRLVEWPDAAIGAKPQGQAVQVSQRNKTRPLSQAAS